MPRFLPKAVVRIGDSFEAVKNKSLQRSNYNFIVIDNPAFSPYGCDYCEHFDLFPDVFSYLGESGVLVINIVYNIGLYTSELGRKIPQKWIDRRKKFYGISKDEEAIKPNPGKMVDVYENLISKGDFNIKNIFLVPRNLTMGHLVIALERNSKKRKI